MKKMTIVTDSTCDLTEEEIAQLDIHVVPLSIIIDGKTYIDRVDISPEAFIEKMEQADELPKSSQPAVGEFLKLFDELGRDGSEVLSIHMSGKLSGTVDAARTAAQMSNTNVTIIDSFFTSKALGFQVRKAAQLSLLGKSLKEITVELERIRTETKLYIVVDTLENLLKGGRIGKGKALLGSLLHIKPIAKLEDGELSPAARVRNHSQAIKYLMKQLLQDIEGKTIRRIELAHADGYELALKMKAKIEELTGFDKIDIHYTTPVIATHAGRGAVGFMYYAD
ncbi:DegV family protein [Bacillus sp. FJAT-50079]|uniref:DegV family protein n=1 Tax=Bacillus sp. FJAT-50079 TaxID=2833577 RepID=UPI001BCA2413|nr:DegV family protein [Bacillus sp. FJAT-50079]MBS4209839.1 DegV family protein [Bacillus sp. FJAT-50079]